VGKSRDRLAFLPTDEGANYDTTVTLDISKLEPMLTFGTNPGMGLSISGKIPDPSVIHDASVRQTLEKSLQYMGFQPNELLAGKKIDVVFIGSCTNARITDLREAARVFLGRKVAPNVRAMVVPAHRKSNVRQKQKDYIKSLLMPALNGASPAAPCA